MKAPLAGEGMLNKMTSDKRRQTSDFFYFQIVLQTRFKIRIRIDVSRGKRNEIINICP